MMNSSLKNPVFFSKIEEQFKVAQTTEEGLLSLKYIIGTDETYLPDILHILSTYYDKKYSSKFLDVLGLILLENKESRNDTIKVILKVFEGCSYLEISNFINYLVSSSYYLHRLAVPKLIVNRNEFKHIILKLLEDEIYIVVRKTIRFLKLYKDCPLDDEQLFNLSLYIFNSKTDFLQSNVVDLLVLLKTPTLEAISLVKDLATCQSWKVRLSVAKNIHIFFDWNYEDENNFIFLSLCEDKENEVRIAIVNQLSNLKINITPYLEKLLKDDNKFIRAETVHQINQIIYKTKNLDYLRLLSESLKDSNTEVRLEALKSIKNIKNDLRIEDLNSILLPLISDFSLNKNWRMRKEVLFIIKDMTSLGEEYFNIYIKSLYFKFFTDPVFEIRETAAKILIDLIVSFKNDWIIKNCLSEIESILKIKNYLYRINLIPVIKEILVRFSYKQTKELVLEMVVNLSRDSVTNVKMALLDAIKDLKNISVFDEYLLPLIADMSVSEDISIREHAEKILNEIGC